MRKTADFYDPTEAIRIASKSVYLPPRWKVEAFFVPSERMVDIEWHGMSVTTKELENYNVTWSCGNLFVQLIDNTGDVFTVFVSDRFSVGTRKNFSYIQDHMPDFYVEMVKSLMNKAELKLRRLKHVSFRPNTRKAISNG